MDCKKYIGMDVHQASISIAVRDVAGKVTKSEAPLAELSLLLADLSLETAVLKKWAFVAIVGTCTRPNGKRRSYAASRKQVVDLRTGRLLVVR